MQRKFREWKVVFGATLTMLLLTMVLVSIVVLPRAGGSPDGWWDTAWKYRQVVTVENPNAFALVEYPTNVSVDTQSLVSAGKMKPDGSDLRVVRDGKAIGFAVVDFNTPSTKVVFKSSVPAGGSNANYTIYYGNPLVSDATLSYDEIRYELVDEFNDGVIDPRWNFTYPGYGGVPIHSEADGCLYIEKEAVGGLAVAFATGIKINNSETLRVQWRAYTAEIGWAGYWGMLVQMFKTNRTSDTISFYTNTYDKSPNVAGPLLDFRNWTTGELVSTEINASRVDWTQTNDRWYDYEVYWSETGNFARMTMNATWYDNENTNGYFEDYRFDELWLGVFAYAPSGREYVKFDYIRIWQDVAQAPTASLGDEQVYAHEVFFALWESILYPVEVDAPNCCLSGFTFDHPQRQISLTAHADAVRSANLTIPQTLLDGVLTAFVDNTITPAIFSTNGTHISVFVTYESGVHLVEIQGQFVTPIPGDLNHDGIVDIFDIVIVAVNFGASE